MTSEQFKQWHRRLVLANDISEQTGGPSVAPSDLLDKIIALTDDECDEAERYAALSFPRSVSMPSALQKVLMPG